MSDSHDILAEAAEELGWSDHTALAVVLDFIDNNKKVRSSFEKYIDRRVKDELKASEG